jgi:hypothetical protein
MTRVHREPSLPRSLRGRRRRPRGLVELFLLARRGFVDRGGNPGVRLPINLLVGLEVPNREVPPAFTSWIWPLPLWMN